MVKKYLNQGDSLEGSSVWNYQGSKGQSTGKENSSSTSDASPKPIESVDYIASPESSMLWDYDQSKAQLPVPYRDDNSKPVHECEFTEKLKKAKAEKCKFASVLIKKDNRSLTVDASSKINTFEVVAGNLEKLHEKLHGGVLNFSFKPAKVEITTNGLVGPCSADHKNKVHDISFKSVENTDAKLKLELFSDWYFFPCLAKPVVYTVNLRTCGTSFPVHIHAYPDIEMGVQIELQLTEETTAVEQTKEVKDSKTEGYGRRTNQNRKEKKKLVTLLAETEEYETIKITDSLSVGGYYKFSGQEIEIKKVFGSVLETIKKIDSFVTNIKTKVGNLQDENDKIVAQNNFDRQTQSSFKLIMGKFVLRVLGAWEETDGAPTCEYGLVLFIAAKPLIGVEWKMDLSGWILKMNPLGRAVGWFKDLLSRLDQKFLEVTLTAGGKVNIELKFEFGLNQPGGMKTSGKGEFELPIKLDIKVIKVSLHKWKFNFEGDISASAETGLKFVLAGNKAGAKFTIEFSGVKLTFIAKGSASFGSQEKGPPPDSSNLKPLKEGEKNKKERSVEFVAKIPGDKWYEKSFPFAK